jgi:hypothetical protein
VVSAHPVSDAILAQHELRRRHRTQGFDGRAARVAAMGVRATVVGSPTSRSKFDTEVLSATTRASRGYATR